ncbi:TetR/AcrR family transcriptional regulator C-terminal domain-containing protein [Streptomyces sp. NPDC052236]|uniref:TetR/AcrR family transcriptional regulator C-terminal domain-containing protein n=1 Tax=Streptomyces sp. NPDC052236 TaxID=3365686 RepID=UPI0037D03D1E
MAADLLASVPPADWREGLTAAMRGLREHLLRYRDGAKVYSGTHFTDLSYAAPREAHLRMLAEAGFTPAAAARAERLKQHPLCRRRGRGGLRGRDAGFETGLAAVVAGIGEVLLARTQST